MCTPNSAIRSPPNSVRVYECRCEGSNLSRFYLSLASPETAPGNEYRDVSPNVRRGGRSRARLTDFAPGLIRICVERNYRLTPVCVGNADDLALSQSSFCVATASNAPAHLGRCPLSPEIRRPHSRGFARFVAYDAWYAMALDRRDRQLRSRLAIKIQPLHDRGTARGCGHSPTALPSTYGG